MPTQQLLRGARSNLPTPPPSGGLNIHEEGLVCYVDAGIAASYGGSGVTWNDISTQSNDHTWDSAPPHVAGSAGYFNVTSQNTLGGNVGFSAAASAWTMEVWFNPDTVSAWQGLWSIGTNASSQGIIFGVNDASNPYIEIPGVGALNGAGIATNPIGTWYSSVVTYNGTVAELFINNVSQGTLTASMALLFGTVELATAFVFNDPYDGRLAAFMAYNDVLTPAERLVNYTEFTSRY